MKALLLLAPVALHASVVVAGPNVYRNPVGMEFLEIPAGTFVMGTPNLDEVIAENPKGRIDTVRDEHPPHSVTFTTPFYLGTTEVTQGQWLEVMGTQPGPAPYWSARDWRRLPVVSVSWHDAERFIQRLQVRDPKTRYRLPTEAEWEYAARAGTQGLRPTRAQAVAGHAWYIKNSGDVPHPVATRAPNPWGLYDMLGNVWEWTRDWYARDYYARAAESDPQGPATGDKRVRRGGSYHCSLHMVRPGYRSADSPDTAYSVVGFRLVAIPDDRN
ncbi:MAG: formylglycine-generating enzyme family protein [Burkholderiales bacterium]|jgi:formylglycine-generating enzyme required for sulfatase activity